MIPANTRVHVKRAGRGLEQTEVILVHTVRQCHGAIKREAHLTAVRVTGQHQIESASLLLYPRRIVHQQHGFGIGIQGRGNLAGTPTGDAHKIDFPAGRGLLFIQQPGAAGGPKTLADVRKRRPTPIIMIPGHAKQGRLDARKNFQRLRQEPAFLHDIAREANEVR